MKIMQEFNDWLFSARTANKVINENRKQEKLTDQEKRQLKRDERKVTMIDLTYDKHEDAYHMHIHNNRKGRDVREGSVHQTGKKNTYVWTDIWPELTWAKEGQSAIHMYLWMINTKINPDAISEKRKVGADIDYKKILMYGAIAVVVIIIAWQFIPKAG